MEAQEIFELIVKADERIKYATADRTGTRARQALELLERAIQEARAIGEDALVSQAKQRLADFANLIGWGEEKT